MVLDSNLVTVVWFFLEIGELSVRGKQRGDRGSLVVRVRIEILKWIRLIKYRSKYIYLSTLFID